ncbi:MAG: TRAP transporter large permease subunit [Flexilinea sp.]
MLENSKKTKKSLGDIWTSCENILAVSFLAFGMLLMFYQVLSRYFLGFSVYWSEEIVRYLIIWSNFIGASIIVKPGPDSHISVDFFVDKFNESRRKVLGMATSLLCFVYSAMLFFTGIELIRKSIAQGSISDTRLETPMWIPYLIMPLAGFMISARWIQRIVSVRLDNGWYKDLFTYIVLAIVVGLGVFSFTSTSPIAVMLIGMFLLMFMGMPIGFAMGLMGSITLYAFDLVSWSSIASKQFWAVNSFTLLAIPFFIFAGSIIAKTPMGKYIVDLTCYLLKRVTGGVGIAIMIASIIFASMSGSSVATAATLGMVALPMLRKAKYPDELSAGMLGAGGTLAVIVPPSSILVLYGAVSGASISNLFTAGTIPGIAICFLLCGYVYYRAKKGKFGAADRDTEFSWKVAFELFKKAIWALLIPLIIMGTIYGGLTTPTEAAVVASVYAVIISLVVYKGITLKDIYDVLKKTVYMSAMIYAIIMSSALFGFIISMERIPQQILELILSSEMSSLAFLMLLNLIIPVFGFFLGPAAIIVMLVPIVVPIANALGINLVHLGLLMALQMEMDFIMPPLGTNLYVIAGVAKIPVEKVIKGVLPFIVILLAALIAITVFPEISLFMIK